MSTILIIDTEETIHDAFGSVLQPLGHRVTSCRKVATALQAFERGSAEVVIASVDEGGLEVARKIKEKSPAVKLIMTATRPSKESALASLRAGACDYLAKPVGVKEFVESVNRSLGIADATAPAFLTGKAEPTPAPLVLAGKTSDARKLREQVEAVRVSRFQPSILVQGARGGGKRSLVRHLHRVRKGAEAPLEWVDCAEGIDALLSGDNGSSVVAKAEGGTLVLDGVDRLSVEQQKKLAGAFTRIEEKIFLICISDSDLDEALTLGKFHIGFYFQIATKVIEVPAPAKRLEDAAALLEHLLEMAKESGKAEASLKVAPAVEEAMKKASSLDLLEQAVLGVLKDNAGKRLDATDLETKIAELNKRSGSGR